MAESDADALGTDVALWLADCSDDEPTTGACDGTGGGIWTGLAGEADAFLLRADLARVFGVAVLACEPAMVVAAAGAPAMKFPI